MIIFEKDITAKIKTDFQENSNKALTLLEEALNDEEALKPSRIIRCIIFLAEGTISGLKNSIAMAKLDPRDVMMCAEYEYDPVANNDSRIRDFSKIFGEE